MFYIVFVFHFGTILDNSSIIITRSTTCKGQRSKDTNTNTLMYHNYNYTYKHNDDGISSSMCYVTYTCVFPFIIKFKMADKESVMQLVLS
jgi:2-oxo-4-hydroxy-4-carboxy--5-ureidoimidazoline (OHCU) decarboxylase